MIVLIGCEQSGRVRDAFRRHGVEAWSCDLQPCEPSRWDRFHLQGDVRRILNGFIPRDMVDDRLGMVGFEGVPVLRKWDLFIVHPDCSYLCASGLHWNKRRPEREIETQKALGFIEEMARAPIERIAIENPRGCIGTKLDLRQYGFTARKATQTIQPYDFGDDASKMTDLWLKNLPPLKLTKYVPPRAVCPECDWVYHDELATVAFTGGCPHCGAEAGLIRPRWANQTDSGQNRLGPSDDRAKIRAATYPGIAEAFAQQWGNYGCALSVSLL